MSKKATINLNTFVPRDYQKCIFNAIEKDGYKRVMAIWPRRCLSGSTRITMADDSFKYLCDIQVGDKILSWDGKKFVTDIVKNAWKTSKKDTVKIETVAPNERVQHPIICSLDHKFAVVNVEGDVLWKKASSLAKGRYKVLRHSRRFLKELNADKLAGVCGNIELGSCLKYEFIVTKSEPEELYDIETECHHNFVANGYVVHNSGKDITAWNLCIRELIRSAKTIYYVFPTFSSGRRILWDAIDNDGFRIIDYMPKDLIESKHEQYMRIKLKNGSLFQIIGSDSYDTSLIGTNPHMVVFSEFALSDPEAYKFVRPILSANDGKLLIVSTPRGKNFLFEMYNTALQNPDDWFVSHLTVDDTKHISMDTILKERELGEMSEDLQQQEYFCSFLQGVEGSYYSKYMDRLRLNGQIGIVPWEPQYLVNTSWDIGVRDSTAIVFSQCVGQTIRVIDYYEKNKEGLEHYINMLNGKPYTYGRHVGPHDIRNREFSSGVTRWEKARQLGVTFDVADKLSLMDGIEAVRSTLPRMWFDEKKCKSLIKSIESYRQEYDSKKKIYKTTPLHDSHSHACDSLRYLAIHLPKLRIGMTPDDLAQLRHEAHHGKQSNLPPFFR